MNDVSAPVQFTIEDVAAIVSKEAKHLINRVKVFEAHPSFDSRADLKASANKLTGMYSLLIQMNKFWEIEGSDVKENVKTARAVVELLYAKKQYRVEKRIHMSEQKKVPAKEITIGGATFTLWCDGKDYDAESEEYRAVYSYSIVTPRWRYDSNNIVGPANKSSNLDVALAGLLLMVKSCAEGQDKENETLFPVHVRNMGKEILDELSLVCSSFGEE